MKGTGKHTAKHSGTNDRISKYKASIISVLLIAAMFSTMAMADEWDISKGDVIVNATTDTDGKTVQTVTGYNATTGQQEKDFVETTDTVITGGTENAPATNNIEIKTQGEGTTANITLDNVNIAASSGPAIDVGGSNAVITIEGDNAVSASDVAIKVTSGSLTIQGDDSAKLTAQSSGGYGAAIGTGRFGETEMSGDINITGGTVTAKSNYGAGIGAGNNGEMSGDINITGGTVNATGGYGAGIGGGQQGAMSGNINISGGTVTANGNHASGIGSGQQGAMSGNIIISDSAKVIATASLGAGIGGGQQGDMTGTITISGNADVTAKSTYKSPGKYGSGAAIGAGQTGNLSGSITISDSATVDAQAQKGDSIGIGGGAATTGTVAEEAQLNVDSTAIINGTKVSAMTEEQKAEAFGTIASENVGSLNIVLKPEPEQNAPSVGNTVSKLFAGIGDAGIANNKYSVVEGKDAEWTIGSEDGLVFELSHEGVIRVEIDGVEVEAAIDGVMITISAEVLAALDEGEHTIEFIFADGSAETQIFVK